MCGACISTIPRPVLQALMEARLRGLKYLTFTTLSHPAETMTGFIALGLNLTHDTLHREMLVRRRFVIMGTSAYHSVWPSSWMLNLHSPSVFQSLIVLSRLPLTICLLSAENETESTSEVCPTKRRVVTPVFKSQRRRVWSQDAESAYMPSEEMTTSDTKWLWP